jgi:hypothetical protein
MALDIIRSHEYSLSPVLSKPTYIVSCHAVDMNASLVRDALTLGTAELIARGWLKRGYRDVVIYQSILMASL